MEQRTAVLRQLMEDRVMSAQQRSDSELKQMMREISRIQTQADDKIADNQKADIRDRNWSEERVTQLEEKMEAERRQRVGLTDALEEKFQVRLKTVEKQLEQEQQKSEDQKKLVANNLKGARDDVQQARVSSDDAVKAEVRARLQSIEQAEQKVEWLIK